MEYTILKSDSFQTKTWSGGTSTELFIFPKNSNYQEKNFQFRLSTATVEVEKSEFTSLPGVSRKLMVLSGSTTLTHEGHHSKKLNPFEVDSFEGDWETSSIGKCTDFNLMTTGSASGALKGMKLGMDDEFNSKIGTKVNWLFIYLFSGRVKASIHHQNISMSKGDLVVIEKPGLLDLCIKGIGDSVLAMAELV